MEMLKKCLNGIGAVLSGCVILTAIIAWMITFISLTYGLAIWSMNWLFSMI